MDRYSNFCQPHVLRSMYKFVSGDCSAPSHENEAAIDMRLMDFIMLGDDPDLVVDMRKHNGRVADERYDGMNLKN